MIYHMTEWNFMKLSTDMIAWHKDQFEVTNHCFWTSAQYAVDLLTFGNHQNLLWKWKRGTVMFHFHQVLNCPLPCSPCTCSSLHLEHFYPFICTCSLRPVLQSWECHRSFLWTPQELSPSPDTLSHCIFVLTYCPPLPSRKTLHHWNYALNTFLNLLFIKIDFDYIYFLKILLEKHYSMNQCHKVSGIVKENRATERRNQINQPQ